MELMMVFGVVALVLAAVGIYGVIAFASSERRGEVATRLALGARRALRVNPAVSLVPCNPQPGRVIEVRIWTRSA